MVKNPSEQLSLSLNRFYTADGHSVMKLTDYSPSSAALMNFLARSLCEGPMSIIGSFVDNILPSTRDCFRGVGRAKTQRLV